MDLTNILTNRDLYWRLTLILCIACAVVSACDIAFASATSASASAGATGNDVIGNTLCRLVANISGGIAKSIATIAIFAVGIGMFLGKLNWGVAAATAAGVGVVFGAGKLVAWLSGDGGNSNCPTA